jgi:tRNA(Arg) A34 adenosine deaminase TadA
MTNKPGEVFIYEPSNMPVSAAQAADLVTHEDASCRNFIINPNYQPRTLDQVRGIHMEMKNASPESEAQLLSEAIELALKSADKGGYGVGALLATIRDEAHHILIQAENTRIHGHTHQFIGHAEMRLVDQSTEYLQSPADHSHDKAVVNLCPCPGCFNHLVDTHIPTVIIGTVDPQVGAAFLKGRDLDIAVGNPRAQVIEHKNLEYRFPEITDENVRAILLDLSWSVFHATRGLVHKKHHEGDLKQ